jgi:hypothetical protein
MACFETDERLDARILEKRAHRWVERTVGSTDAMSGLRKEARERRHPGTANSYQVDVETGFLHGFGSGGSGSIALPKAGLQRRSRDLSVSRKEGDFVKTTVLKVAPLVLMLIPGMVLAQPRAVAVDPVIDVGVVNRGAKVEHRFEIRNEGDEELAIREVEPACGCTVAEYDRTIAPGQTGTVQAVVDTSDFRGPIAKSVTVFTTDPDNAKFTLTIKANIKMQIESKPGYARMIVVQGEPTEPIRQWLWAPEGPALEVTGVTSPYSFVEVSHRKATAEERKAEGADSQWLVDVKVAQNAPVGPVAGNVLVKTNHPRQKEVRIPVSGFVRPVVSVKPRAADFGRVELAEPYSATLDLRNLGSGPISVLSASTDIAGVEAEVEEVEAGKRYRVSVTLQPGMASGPFQGSIQIETSSELAPMLEVEMTGTVL